LFRTFVPCTGEKRTLDLFHLLTITIGFVDELTKDGYGDTEVLIHSSQLKNWCKSLTIRCVRASRAPWQVTKTRIVQSFHFDLQIVVL
jgi:hypothetical protein